MTDAEETKGKGGSVQIRVLYSEGCANVSPTLDLLKYVAQDLDILANIEMVTVGTPEQAQELRFLGSPTVQIEGVDIDPSARDSIAFGFA